ncbi:MAG: peptidyl-prolyl cis-trans isomerase [Inquilinus sp.]|uniref:peptidylprolyl isomerase n=1 Tax=Inquilinus sp. TaxID=1932117 RepID=UPI003F3D6DD6
MNLLKEPLLHFAVAGVALFSIYASLNESLPAAEGIEPVSIGAGEVQWLRETYANQWLRPPDTVELQGLVTDLVNEELLAREAQAMGLGESDTIIRRRLAQKLKFLVEDTSRLAEPTDAELHQYFDKNIARFETGATVSFTHIFFNPQDRADTAHDAAVALAGLQKVDLNAQAAGDRFLLDSEFREADEQTVSSMFGEEFAKAVFGLQPGQWRGPLKSGYGLHLVFVSARTAAGRPQFDTVRDTVVEEWRREQEEKTNREFLARLHEKYGVAFDDGVKALLEPQPAAAR